MKKTVFMIHGKKALLQLHSLKGFMGGISVKLGNLYNIGWSNVSLMEVDD